MTAPFVEQNEEICLAKSMNFEQINKIQKQLLRKTTK